MKGKSDMKVPEYLYYYCSFNTFVSIIKNNSIWLTDITKSNDSMELKFLYDQFMRKILWLFNGKDDKLKLLFYELNFRYEGIIDYMLPSVWALCFSKNRDLLSQWRGYSDNGAGVCIKFKGEYLNLFKNNYSQTEFKMCEFKKINYSTKLIINKYEKMINDYINANPKIIDDKRKSTDYIDKCVKQLSFKCPLYKKDSFREESEWRLVVALPYCKDKNINLLDDAYRNFNNKEDFKPINFDYAVCKGRLISHFELNINLREAIDEIIIGPSSKVTKFDIESFLISCNINEDIIGKNIIVNYSDSSYRSD